MNELTGPELTVRLRSLLPPAQQGFYDSELDSYSYVVDGESKPSISICGALLALVWPFARCAAEGDTATVIAVLDEMERLLREYPDPEPRDGTVANSVLACFLEDALPVALPAHHVIRPHIGPLIEAHARLYEPSWLLPEPASRDIAER